MIYCFPIISLFIAIYHYYVRKVTLIMSEKLHLLFTYYYLVTIIIFHYYIYYYMLSYGNVRKSKGSRRLGLG
jgi:hypothetical protein